MPKRYQPFQFQTNDSMSDCIYSKSICNGEGHIVYNDDSSKNDRTCRCDYKRNYSFIKTPRHVCYCLPSEEDCSCYIKSCPVNLTMTADYDCSSNTYNKKLKCMETTSNSKIKDEKTKVNMEKDDFLRNNISSGTTTPAVFILIYLCLIGICGFTSSSKWLREKLKPLKKLFRDRFNR
ncbi:uncharacterized protein LOC143051010 [Mytilus galloprovincialis]|uniref:uncharacterized protein LOC143051010 n=1 Tax=Mytilus galloprovincialis TaxID=29158 RepID=UPI003F7CA8EA